jgi:hypothetical protein
VRANATSGARKAEHPRQPDRAARETPGAAVLRLQRAAGNRAVAKLARAPSKPGPAKRAAAPAKPAASQTGIFDPTAIDRFARKAAWFYREHGEVTIEAYGDYLVAAADTELIGVGVPPVNSPDRGATGDIQGASGDFGDTDWTIRLNLEPVRRGKPSAKASSTTSTWRRSRRPSITRRATPSSISAPAGCARPGTSATR